MITRWLFLVMLLGLIHLSTLSNCQTAELYLISSGGGVLNSNNQTITFTVGDIATETFSTNDLFITQGFLQTNEISISIDEILNFSDEILVYPNPTSSFVNIGLLNIDNNNIEFSLNIIDVNGKLMYSNQIQTIEYKIDLRNYLSGIYFIKLHNLNNDKSYV